MYRTAQTPEGAIEGLKGLCVRGAGRREGRDRTVQDRRAARRHVMTPTPGACRPGRITPSRLTATPGSANGYLVAEYEIASLGANVDLKRTPGDHPVLRAAV